MGFNRKNIILLTGFLQIYQAYSQKAKKIELQHANVLEYDMESGKDVKRLLGNVVFSHENVLMYCDSAYLYSAENRLEAFHNIHINKEDSVHIYGDILKYDGNSRFAEIHDNVRMNSRDFNLTGEHLFYDMAANKAFYYDGAVIDDLQNRMTLFSKRGYYFTGSRLFYFKDSVRLKHPDYSIVTDTLKYNPESKMTWFLGPTMLKSDTGYIYCEDGWYDTQKDIAMFRKRAFLASGNEQLGADSIYYERKKGRGEAYHHIKFHDIKEDIYIMGDRGKYFDNFSSSVVTGKAVMIMAYRDDSLFLHGDTLKAWQDSSSGKKTFYAYRHVKFFKTDLQGVCDSLVYSEKDSMIFLYNDPVLWTDENQLTGDSITISMYNNDIHSMFLKNNAFIVSRINLTGDSATVDSIGYNQIRGKSMTGYFTDNRLHRIDVNGNGKTIYYVEDEKNGFIGVNKAECSNMIIRIKGDENDTTDGKSRKIDRITFLTKPEAVLYPMNELLPEDLYLRKILWLGERRPKSRTDIF